jgi:ferredoxin
MSHIHDKRYVLKNDGSATPFFSVEVKSPIAGRQSEENLLLQSGFSPETAPSGCVVSAALQLNGDCTSMDEESLARFGSAELEKHHRVSYKTYDVDPDYRVCVIAGDPAELERFLDTYGGLLEIEPLLVGSYSSNYTTADELEISSAGRGYSLSYTVKSVVNRSLCTYCGLCGRICPVQCISEELYFDFGACTLCTECEKQCPEKAIDLHAIERISLQIPALVILGEPNLTLPDTQDCLYRLDTMSDFLATLFSCRVEEVITCSHALCHYTPSSKTGCKACLTSCRYGAVKIKDNLVEVDPFSCVECGACVSVCPTGAMQNQKFTDQSFIEFFRTFQLEQGSTAVLGSATDFNRCWWHSDLPTLEHTCFIEVPESGAVALMHLLFLVAHGATRVIILNSAASVDTKINDAVKETNLVCERSIGAREPVSICTPEELGPRLAETTSEARDVTPYRDLSFINRRRKLSSILNHFSALSGTDLNLEEDEVRFVGVIACDDERCTQCLACLNSCKIESLSADTESLSLCWNGSLCIVCQSCVETCPEEALSYTGDGVLLDDAFFTPVEVSRAEPMACEGCGKVFGTKKSFEKVMAILAKKQQTPPEHLRYCEDCRVLKLFEEQ